MSRSEIERSRGLQRGFLVIANSVAAVAAICTVWILNFYSSLIWLKPTLPWANPHHCRCHLHYCSKAHGCPQTSPLIALLKVCVGIWSLTSESFLLPLVPDTLLISSAYIQVISLDVQILVADDVAALIHVTHKSHLISNFCVLIYEQPWVTNSCYWIFASFTKNTKYTLGQNSRICRHAAS